MKTERFFLTMWWLLLPLLTMAQSSLFDKYCDKQGVTSVYISKAMIEMNPKIFAEDPLIAKVSGDLDVVKILSSTSGSFMNSIQKDFQTLVKQEKYELLMKKKNDHALTEFYVVRKGNKVKEFLMLSLVRHTKVKYVYLQGNFSLKDIQGVISSEQTSWNIPATVSDFELLLSDNYNRKQYEEGIKRYQEDMKRYQKEMLKYQKKIKEYTEKFR
ncbi:MAG: DUF4252 domain-containing protein [Mediterranea massiliensis]|nr:DUF4252 domain-containing protein [Mediterranea massiliensis]